MTVIAYLEGGLDPNEIYLGVPTILGAGGIKKMIEIELIDEEKAVLRKSAESVKLDMELLA